MEELTMWKEIIKEVRDSEIGDMEQYERDMLRQERQGSPQDDEVNDQNLGQYTDVIDQEFSDIRHYLDGAIADGDMWPSAITAGTVK